MVLYMGYLNLDSQPQELHKHVQAGNTKQMNLSSCTHFASCRFMRQSNMPQQLSGIGKPKVFSARFVYNNYPRVVLLSHRIVLLMWVQSNNNFRKDVQSELIKTQSRCFSFCLSHVFHPSFFLVEGMFGFVSFPQVLRLVSLGAFWSWWYFLTAWEKWPCSLVRAAGSRVALKFDVWRF